MIRTFVPFLAIACLVAGFAAATAPKAKTAAATQVLYHPGKDKAVIIHPVYRPGIDKFQIIHPVYRPGIDKFVIRNLSYQAPPVISKQTTVTLTSNISEKTLESEGSAAARVPAVKSERGSSECAKKGQHSSE